MAVSEMRKQWEKNANVLLPFPFLFFIQFGTLTYGMIPPTLRTDLPSLVRPVYKSLQGYTCISCTFSVHHENEDKAPFELFVPKDSPPQNSVSVLHFSSFPFLFIFKLHIFSSMSYNLLIFLVFDLFYCWYLLSHFNFMECIPQLKNSVSFY